MKTIKISNPVVLVAIVFLSLTTGCTELENDKYLGANKVWLKNSMFAPSNLTVSAYTTVEWTNKDSCTHTVSSDACLFGSGDILPGGNFSYMFVKPGIYKYHCRDHPMEKGTIIVRQ